MVHPGAGCPAASRRPGEEWLRRGHKRADVAIAHKILIAAYHMLSTGARYEDLGEAYLDQLSQKRVTANLVRRLQRLGYEVQLKEQLA